MTDITLIEAIKQISEEEGTAVVEQFGFGETIHVKIGFTTKVTISMIGESTLQIRYEDSTHVRSPETMNFNIFPPGMDPLEEVMK